MIQSNTSNPFNIRHALNALNQKYSSYLSTEGKWLNGGFETIVQFEENPGDSRNEIVHVKKEIYMMLPAYIREEMASFLPMD